MPFFRGWGIFNAKYGYFYLMRVDLAFVMAFLEKWSM
jgi:hypothetical protein